MKLRVKICGITNLDDALCCVDAGADALGFIFYEKSPRYIQPLAAGKIIRKLPQFMTAVGVFVNERREIIERIVSETGIRIIQLSGDEAVDECLGYTVKVWKAFRIQNIQEVDSIQGFTISAAMLDGASGNLYGGSGKRADVAIACAMKQYHPLILAGGLSPDNIVDAIQSIKPYGVDVNSGVESSHGKKDPSKIHKLFENIEQLNISSLQE
jgi:phosphoribosylanthranilate isomerase